MSSDTLTKVAPAVPEDPAPLCIVPQRRLGQWTAVVVLLMVATLWHTVVTSVLSFGRYYVERHYARGSERTR